MGKVTWQEPDLVILNSNLEDYQQASEDPQRRQELVENSIQRLEERKKIKFDAQLRKVCIRRP